jgi:hypothetical protein
MKEIQETPTDSLLSYANLPEHCQFPTNVVCEFFALPHLGIGDCMITMLSVHHFASLTERPIRNSCMKWEG